MIRLMSLNCVSAAILLMTLALGYIVCCLANKEKKALKNVGFAIGILIIIASSFLMLGRIMCRIKTCDRISRRMMMKGQTPPAQMPMVPQK